MNLLHHVLTDARFSLRLLRRRPAFAATLIGVLVLGIGAVTAMFSVVVSLLLRPLPYPHPEELVQVITVQPQVDPSPASVRDFLDWKAGGTTFRALAAVTYDAVSVSSRGETPESLPAAKVSGDFFDMLQVKPLRGRLLGPEDDRIGGPRVVVISAGVWHRRFASDPSIVGRSVDIGAQPYTVVGIAPEGFIFSGPNSDGTDVWMPLAVSEEGYPELVTDARRGSHFIDVMGRLAPGVTAPQAQAQIAGIAAGLATKYPESNTGVTVRVMDLHDSLVGSARESVWVLFAAVALVFLVVCANVANLLLARASSRRAEMAARAALGATRGRLVRQLVVETIVVFGIAALLGTLLAHYLVALYGGRVIGTVSALTITLQVDWTALVFSIGCALVFGLVFGLVPAGEAYRAPPQAVLAETQARASLGKSARAVRGGLVIGQVALAFALLVGSGLTLRAFIELASTPLGFDVDGLASAAIVLPADKYPDEPSRTAFFREVLARVAARPGVVSVSANATIPMGSSNENGSFEIEGRPPWAPGMRPLLERNTIAPGYFRTMGIPILRGRDFDDGDTKNGRQVLIISKAAAERFFPGQDPIGHRIDWGADGDEGEHHWREIVGVVGDVYRFGRRTPIASESYSPMPQHSKRWMAVVARTQNVPALQNDIPALVAGVDPQQAISSRGSMSQRVSSMLGPQRFTAELLGAFALVALFLATLGLFGLVSYTTTQRTRELGIRLALGSSPERVVSLVMSEGVRLLAVGLALGIAGAVFVGRAVAGRVAGASAFDPLLLGLVFTVLALAGTLASLLPALRAVRIPPSVSLRYE